MAAAMDTYLGWHEQLHCPEELAGKQRWGLSRCSRFGLVGGSWRREVVGRQRLMEEAGRQRLMGEAGRVLLGE